MKKLLLTLSFVGLALSFSSCNVPSTDITYSDEAYFADDVAKIMRNVLLNSFALVESINLKIEKDSIPPEIKISGEPDNIKGWSINFENMKESIFQGELTVEFDKALSEPDVTTTIDCSKLQIDVFHVEGKIDITKEISNDEKIIKRNVSTSNLSWGNSIAPLVELNGNYIISYKLNDKGIIIEPTIAGGASGKHYKHGTFTQNIKSPLTPGDQRPFYAGKINYFVITLSNNIEVEYKQNSWSVTSKGKTETIPYN